MTNATTTEPNAAALATRIRMLCPYCANQDGVINLDLSELNLKDLAAVKCSECEAEFRPADAIEHLTEQLEAWNAIIRWIGMAETAKAEGERD